MVVMMVVELGEKMVEWLAIETVGSLVAVMGY